MTTFVLVHGASQGGWVWDRVVPLLVEAGHRVIAPDLPGAGSRWFPGHPPVRLSDCVRDLQLLVHDYDLDEIVLVGHAEGGAIVRAASEEISDRVRLLAYVDAAVPRNGEATLDLVDASDEQRPDHGAWLPPAPVGDPDGLDPEDAAWINIRCTPAPAGITTDPVTLTTLEAADLPERYAFCSPPSRATSWGATRERLATDGRPFDVLDAGHHAPVDAPKCVADWLLEVAST